MEKRKPHHILMEIQAVVAARGSRPFTKTALDGGRELGLAVVQMKEMVLSIKADHFYKSMTTYADHAIWQDVYHLPDENVGIVYVKLSLAPGRPPVIQFKSVERR